MKIRAYRVALLDPVLKVVQIHGVGNANNLSLGTTRGMCHDALGSSHCRPTAPNGKMAVNNELERTWKEVVLT
jgi:hypothetical protein